MLKGECAKDKFIFNYDHPDDFTKCFWQKKSNVLPTWIAYRLILFLYFFLIFPYIVFWRPEEGYVWYKNFIYYAYWSCFTDVLVFGLAFLITVARFLKEKKDPTLSPLKEMPWHYKTLWVLYNMSAPSSVVITVLFWLFTYKPEIHTNLGFQLVVGLFNTLILLFDFCLWDIPYRFLHFYISLLFATVYIIFTIAYQFSGGTGHAGKPTIYSIVDWRKPARTMTTVGIFLGCHFLFHCGICVIQLFKVWKRKSRED